MSGTPSVRSKPHPTEAVLSGIIQEQRARSIQSKLLEPGRDKLETQNSQLRDIKNWATDDLRDLTIKDEIKKGAMDINNIEMWINKTLKESDFINAAHDKLRNNNANAMADYGVDRQSLESCGLLTSQIDNLYRAYFIHVIGFFTQIEDCVRQFGTKIISNSLLGRQAKKQNPHITKSSLISALWKVFSILVEFAFQNRYKLQIITVEEEFKAQIAKLKAEFDETMAVEKESQKSLMK